MQLNLWHCCYPLVETRCQDAAGLISVLGIPAVPVIACCRKTVLFCHGTARGDPTSCCGKASTSFPLWTGFQHKWVDRRAALWFRRPATSVPVLQAAAGNGRVKRRVVYLDMVESQIMERSGRVFPSEKPNTSIRRVLTWKEFPHSFPWEVIWTHYPCLSLNLVFALYIEKNTCTEQVLYSYTGYKLSIYILLLVIIALHICMVCS